MSKKQLTGTEIIARSMAGMDGHVKDFDLGRDADCEMDYGGRYAGYLCEAEHIVSELSESGWRLVKDGD